MRSLWGTSSRRLLGVTALRVLNAHRMARCVVWKANAIGVWDVCVPPLSSMARNTSLVKGLVNGTSSVTLPEMAITVSVMLISPRCSVRRDLIGLGDVLSSPSSAPPSSSPPDTAAPPLKPPVTKTPAPRARASAQPDLLIVAGSSLKVPGTKRIVREFAKAVQSTRTSVASSRSSTPASQAPSPTKARNPSLSSTLKPPSSSDKDDSEHTLVDSATPQSHSDTESSHSFHDLVAHPPRTIYLNLDFPAPRRDWKGVFDVWVQGDVQQLVETFMNALQERDKNQGAADPAENGKAKSRSRKRKTDADSNEEPSPPRKRKVAPASTANRGEEGAPQSGKRKPPPSRSKAKKMDIDDEDASPEMVAARSLLALSVSPSPPTYNLNPGRRRHRPVVQLQSHRHRQTSTTLPPSNPTSCIPSASSPASAPYQHNRPASGSSLSGVQQEPSPHFNFHTAGYDDRGDRASFRPRQERAGVGWASQKTSSTRVGKRREEECRCHLCKMGRAGLEWPLPPGMTIAQALAAKKRARTTTKQSKASSAPVMDNIQADPALVENGSAALIRTMSLGLRDRGSPRDKSGLELH